MPPEQNDEYTWETESQIDPAFQAREEAWAHQKRLERVQQIAEDDLRRRMIEQVPDIRHEAQKMEILLRELIDSERLKMPPETGRGYFVLNSEKRGTYSGQGNIGAKKYKVRANQAKDPHGNEIIKITLYPM